VFLDFTRPGKPADNAYIELFNGSFRNEFLNTRWFLLLDGAMEKIGRDLEEELQRVQAPFGAGQHEAGGPSEEACKKVGNLKFWRYSFCR
jgi:transposase InsO family protein